MSDHIQHLIRAGEDAQRHYRDRGTALDERMAAWALLGNGAALLFCFNAFLDHKICSWSAISGFTWLFFFGLVCAFAKIVFSHRVLHDAERKMLFVNAASRTAASLLDAKNEALRTGVETELSKQHDAAIAQIAAHQKPKPWLEWIDKAADLCLAASVLAFGGAIYLALSGDVSAMLCATTP